MIHGLLSEREININHGICPEVFQQIADAGFPYYISSRNVARAVVDGPEATAQKVELFQASALHVDNTGSMRDVQVMPSGLVAETSAL